MPVHASDPAAVAEALAGWLERRLSTAVTVEEPARAVGGGFDSRIHLLRFGGAGVPAPWRQPLVARVMPDAGRMARAEEEARLQTWLAGQGYPAPSVLAVAGPGEALDLPVQVMERVPGTTMAEAIERQPWRARALMARLADLHARLHRLDPAGWPVAAGAGDLADRRLSLVRREAARTADPELRRGLERVERLLDRLTGAGRSVCHGDFHPGNVLVDGATATVIDWTDAGLGDRHGDVSRTILLFQLAPLLVARRTGERAALRLIGPALARWYLRSYRSQLDVQPHGLALWEPLHLLHAMAQARRAPRPSANALQAWLRARFDRRLSELGA